MPTTLTNYRPAGRSAIMRYVAPLARSAVPVAAGAFMPSARGLGKAARDFYNGYSAGASAPRSKAVMVERSTQSEVIAAPVSYATRLRGSKARITASRGKKPTVITHRELINGSVAGSTTFTVQNSYSLNPGIAATFPWLSTQASQYEEYKFRSLSFQYVPIAPTSTQGDIHLIPEYDPVNPAPSTEVQALDHYGSISNSVWAPVTIKFDTKSMHSTGTRKFVRTSVVPSDLKTFDGGLFHVCTNNETGTSTIGKLFVEYTVELYTPFIGPQPGSSSSTVSMFTNSGTQTLTTTTPTNVAFANGVANPLGITIGSAQWTLPIGTWLVRAKVVCVDSASENFAGTLKIQQGGADLNPTALSAFNMGTATAPTNTLVSESIVTVTASNSAVITIVCTLTGAAGTLTLPIGDSSLTFRVI